MAKLGFLGDIHGNIQALNDVLADMENHNLDKYICLGDFVSEFADDECVQRVQSLVKLGIFTSVLGNHDEQAVKGYLTESNISKESCEYLRNLPLSITEDEVHITHANPIDASRSGQGVWRPYGEYINAHNIAELVFEKCEHRIIAVGHTHVPVVYSETESINPVNNPVCIKEGRFIINPGAVGYSRVSNNTANYAVLDTETMVFEVKAIQTQSLQTGIPAGMIT